MSKSNNPVDIFVEASDATFVKDNFAYLCRLRNYSIDHFIRFCEACREPIVKENDLYQFSRGNLEDVDHFLHRWCAEKLPQHGGLPVIPE